MSESERRARLAAIREVIDTTYVDLNRIIDELTQQLTLVADSVLVVDEVAAVPETPDFDIVAWLLREGSTRFPRAQLPQPDFIVTLFAAIDNSIPLMEDVIEILADYDSRQRIHSLGGMLKRTIEQAHGDFRAIEAQAAALRTIHAEDPLSIVDAAINATAARVAALPPRREPSGAAVMRLAKITQAGKEAGLGTTA